MAQRGQIASQFTASCWLENTSVITPRFWPTRTPNPSIVGGLPTNANLGPIPPCRRYVASSAPRCTSQTWKAFRSAQGSSPQFCLLLSLCLGTLPAEFDDQRLVDAPAHNAGERRNPCSRFLWAPAEGISGSCTSRAQCGFSQAARANPTLRQICASHLPSESIASAEYQPLLGKNVIIAAVEKR